MMNQSSRAETLDVTISELVDTWGVYTTEEIKEDFERSGKVVPTALTQEVDNKYIEDIQFMKKMLEANPNDIELKKHAKQLLNDIAVNLRSEDIRTFLYDNIISDLNNLNELGLNKVMGFTRDLILVKKYLKDKE